MAGPEPRSMHPGLHPHRACTRYPALAPHEVMVSWVEIPHK